MTRSNTASSLLAPLDTDLPPATVLLLQQVRACTLCAPYLPLGVRPVVQVHQAARILVHNGVQEALVDDSSPGLIIRVSCLKRNPESTNTETFKQACMCDVREKTVHRFYCLLYDMLCLMI